MQGKETEGIEDRPDGLVNFAREANNMANYDTIGGLTDVIDNAINTGALSGATGAAIAGILAGLTGSSSIAGALQSEDVGTADLADITSPVVVMTDGAKFDAQIDASSPIRAVVAATDSNSNNITFATDADVAVQLGGGYNDKVTTAGGDDVVTFVGGVNSTATVNTGAGNDTVVLQAYSATNNGGEAQVALGTGNDVVELRGWEGKATIDGGDGFDQLQVAGARGEHTFSYVNGHFVMNSAGITMDNVNVVTFDNTPDNGVDNVDSITVLADTAGDAIVAKLYQVALGRQAIDDAMGTNGLGGDDAIRGALGGISYWTEVFNQGSNSGADLQNTVYRFLGSGEFQQLYCGVDDTTFVTQLFHNLDKVSPNFPVLMEVNGKSVQDFVNQLDGSQEARWDVAWEIASSDQASQILGQDGIGYVIEASGLDDGPQSA